MATSALIGALRVTLGLDTAAFEQGAEKAARRSGKLEQDIRGHLSKISGSMSSLVAVGSGLAATIAGLGLVTAAREALDYASSLGEVAQQLGVSARTLQEYRYIGTQVGIDQAQMDAGLQKLTRSIGMAGEGSKKQATAFADLGISVRDANGNLRSTDEVLPQIISALSNIKEPAARATIEMALFGKSGQQLDTLLAGGIDQVNNLRKAAADLGLVLSEDQIANADRTADKLAELKTVLSANIARIVTDNASSIYGLVAALERLIAKVPAANNALNNFKDNLIKAQSIGAATVDLLAGRLDLARLNVAEGKKAEARIFQRNSGDLVNANGMQELADLRRDLGRGQRGGGIVGSIDVGGGGDGGAGGGGARRRARGGGGGRAVQSSEDKLAQTLDSLLPEDAERRSLAAQAKILRAALVRGGLDQATFDRALGAVGDRQDRISRTGTAPLAGNDNDGADPFGLSTKVKVELVDLKGLLKDVQVTNGDLGQSFADMARDGANALQGLANSIRGGGLLDILGGVLDAFLTLGNSGILGGKIQTNLRSGIAGARAMGGPVDGGRTYLVGERGPELFTAPGAGRIIPNGAFGGGSPVSFDLRGAVMTADLVQQMQVIANDTGGKLVTANNATLMKRSRQRLGR